MDPLQGERQEVEVILDVIRSEGSLDLRVLKGFSFIYEQSFSGLKQLRTKPTASTCSCWVTPPETCNRTFPSG